MANRGLARERTSRPRSTALGAILALILVAVPFVAGHLLGASGANDGHPGGGRHMYFSPAAWPERGQAAIVVGDGEPAASPDQRPAPIASLAKVMTAYLTLRRYPLSGARDGFTINITADEAAGVAEEADQGQSVVAVEAGEALTERQLLEALLVPSGNDIARILATRLAGNEARFVAEMNAAARALGMDRTTYTDPSGFDPGTVSTAADQLRVFRRAMRSPAFRQIVSTGSVILPVVGTVTNFNPLLAAGYAGKTGSDSAAGGCLAFFTQVTTGGRRRTAVGVVMGQGEGSETAALLGAAGEAAERLVGSATGGIAGRDSATGAPSGAFRPRIENRIRAGNAAPPRLGAMTSSNRKEPR
jgi:serine-type D-Ala-D-Ala carboxypeptidase (penicillin-binding protein 5/6)